MSSNNRLNRPKANVISGLMPDENIYVGTHLTNLGDVDVLEKKDRFKRKRNYSFEIVDGNIESIIRARDNDINIYLTTHYGSMDAEDAKRMYESAIENPSDTKWIGCDSN